MRYFNTNHLELEAESTNFSATEKVMVVLAQISLNPNDKYLEACMRFLSIHVCK